MSLLIVYAFPTLKKLGFDLINFPSLYTNPDYSALNLRNYDEAGQIPCLRHLHKKHVNAVGNKCARQLYI